MQPTARLELNTHSVREDASLDEAVTMSQVGSVMSDGVDMSQVDGYIKVMRVDVKTYTG
jgi:hypothetical protein